MEIGIIIKDLIMGMIGVIVPILSTFVGQFIREKVKQSKTQTDDYLAGIAVEWAEDTLGKGNGPHKLKAAAKKVMELSKGKMDADKAEVLVRSAYQNLYGELKHLKN